MRYTVKINRQASRDLTEIFKYIEDREKSAAPAERLTNALVDSALGLAQFPYRGQVMKRRPKARRLVHGNYLIIFEIRESQRHVEILRFLHGARICFHLGALVGISFWTTRYVFDSDDVVEPVARM